VEDSLLFLLELIWHGMCLVFEVLWNILSFIPEFCIDWLESGGLDFGGSTDDKKRGPNGKC
jgi:hypothetical protein